ncbi:MAG: Fic family protein [Gallionellaceae bacterium]
MSKYQFNESDIYISGSDIPKNRLGIAEPELLQEVEETLLQQAYQTFIVECEFATRFDEAYFKSLHQRTFETLYEWAGVYRTVDMSKGGSLFCRAAYLEQESRRIFRQLEEDFLHQSNAWQPAKFAERLAFYQSELIALHPFYELNGRITRLFFDLIAVANGYAPIDYSQALQGQPLNAYIQASIACVQQANHEKLSQIIFRGLSKLDQ